jgi:branched-chain amino acid aminotransferase
MEERICYFNGSFVPETEARVPFTDRGLRWGDGVFETERTFAGELFALPAHIQRLFHSLKLVRIDPRMTPSEVENITREVARLNEAHRDSRGDNWVTQMITRGSGWTTADDDPPTICIRAYPIDFSRYARHYQSGCHIVFSRTRSYSTNSLDPRIKHLSRMNFVQAELEAHDLDPASYPVLLDLDGNITEYAAGNFFLVTDGVLRTPRTKHLLAGVTRRTTVELAGKLGIPVREEDLQPYDAHTADEIFLTTTSFCVLPVSYIDGRQLDAEVPGAITQRLLNAWNELVGLDIVGQAMQFISAPASHEVGFR